MKVSFTMMEVLSFLKKFHNLPENAIIEIDGQQIQEDAVTSLQKTIWMVLSHPSNNKRKIPLIKFIREVTGLGLKHAKEVADEIVGNYDGSKAPTIFSSSKMVELVEKHSGNWKESDYEGLKYTFANAKRDLLKENLKSI